VINVPYCNSKVKINTAHACVREGGLHGSTAHSAPSSHSNLPPILYEAV
jgi:hypothetical protein